MAFERKSAMVSIALLVMVAVTMSKVDGRLLDDQSNRRGIKTDEGRNLMNIVGVGKHCCNKVITTCCAPAPAPKPTSKVSKESKPKSSTPKAPAPKASIFKAIPPVKSLFKKSPKASAPKSSKASKAPTPKASKTSTPKSPKTPTAKSPKAAPIPKL